MRISWRWKKHFLPDNLSSVLCNPFQAKNVAAGVSLLMKLPVYPGEPPSHTVPTMYVLAFQKRHIPALSVSSYPMICFGTWPGETSVFCRQYNLL